MKANLRRGKINSINYISVYYYGYIGEIYKTISSFHNLKEHLHPSPEYLLTQLVLRKMSQMSLFMFEIIHEAFVLSDFLFRLSSFS